MSRKYKFHEKEGAYFISFATIFWIDLFTRMGNVSDLLVLLQVIDNQYKLRFKKLKIGSSRLPKHKK